MGFITKLDYSDNRQIRQRVETQTQLSGGTTFGVPYSELVRGVDYSTTGVTSTSSGVTSTFSGNTGTTIFFFGDTRMELAGADLEPITPSNSGDTQNAGVTYTGDTTTIVDNNQVFLTYTGIGYNLIVTNFEEVSAGNYTGETTSDLTFYSGNTADYTGSSVWLTSEDSARVKGVLYANVLSATTIVGATISGATDNFTTGSTLVGSTAYFNRTDSLSAYTLDLSSLAVNDNFTTGSTLVGNTLYFNRTDSLSAYTADLSPLSGGTPSLNDGEIFVGNASNEATSVPMGGDVAITNAGVTTIQPDTVTYDKMQDTTQAALLGNETGAGTIAEIPIVEQYLTTGAITALLENTANWDINGVYTGSAITGTFQGQSHYDGNYYFTAVDDNVWIRLIRG